MKRRPSSLTFQGRTKSPCCSAPAGRPMAVLWVTLDSLLLALMASPQLSSVNRGHAASLANICPRLSVVASTLNMPRAESWLKATGKHWSSDFSMKGQHQKDYIPAKSLQTFKAGTGRREAYRKQLQILHSSQGIIIWFCLTM